MADVTPRTSAAPVQLPDVETLRALFHYNPETGVLTWRLRPPLTYAARIWNKRFAGREAGSLTKRGYRVVEIYRRAYKVHRVAFKMATGDEPPAQIDHINGDHSDNRFANLRPATSSENCANKAVQRNSTTGVKGVTYHKRERGYVARVQLRGRSHYVGVFKTLDAAKAARDAKALELHGEFFRG